MRGKAVNTCRGECEGFSQLSHIFPAAVNLPLALVDRGLLGWVAQWTQDARGRPCGVRKATMHAATWRAIPDHPSSLGIRRVVGNPIHGPAAELDSSPLHAEGPLGAKIMAAMRGPLDPTQDLATRKARGTKVPRRPVAAHRRERKVGKETRFRNTRPIPEAAARCVDVCRPTSR